MKRIRVYLFWIITSGIVMISSVYKFLDIELPFHAAAKELPQYVKVIIIVVTIILLIWAWPLRKQRSK